MKRLLLILLILFLITGVFALEADAKLSLSATIAEVLRQGFFVEEGEPLADSITVSNAFRSEGATFTYVIETNLMYPLSISATIDPFTLIDGAEEDDTISIQRITVTTEGQAPNIVDLSESPLSLISLHHQSIGVSQYEYIINVLANQDEVSEAKAGQYQTTMTIRIQSES